MIKPDWNVFKAKFSDNPQYHFEWFCYLLFCERFNKPYGIFRYKNQSGIETNPIYHEKEQIGFQAKFYDSSLSAHKQDILDTLTKAKRDYPTLNTIIFYSNQEWGQSHSKGKSTVKSKVLLDIESESSRLDIKLEWCTTSFFESKFVAIDCKKITKYFFQEDSNLIKSIKYLEKHTELILSPVNEKISYKEKEIIFDRNYILEKLEETSSYNISILSGVGGVGKTVEIKNLYNKLKNTTPFFVFKASEFEINRLDELNYDGNIYDFAEYFNDCKSKIIVIDSAEKLLDLSNQDPIKEFISLILKYNWKIIFTTRLTYLDDLNFLCIEVLHSSPLSINIPTLNIEELEELANSHNIPLPKDEKLIELLLTPLYLNEYLKITNNKALFDYNDFKNKIWNTKIKCNNVKREKTFLELAFNRANDGLFFIKTNNDNIETIGELVHDGILGCEQNNYFIAHDLYEEWALEIIINQQYITKKSSLSFFKKIGSSLPIRRAFRNWMSNKISQNTNDIEIFIEEIIDDELTDMFWKDEIIVSILLSKYSNVFFNYYDDELLSNKFDLFKRLCFMLRIACKEFDNQAFINLGLNPMAKSILPYGSLFTKPKGEGWVSLIDFLFRNISRLDKCHANFILPIVYDWNNKFKEGITTKQSSLIALKFYQSEGYSRISKPDEAHHLLTTIANGAKETREEISKILDEIITQQHTNYNSSFIGLSYLILTEFAGLNIAKVLPEKTISLAKVFWLKDYTDENDPMFQARDAEEKPFGITDDYHLKYYPESPYQTPILALLVSNQKATIDFIVDFINSVATSLVRYYGDNNISRLIVNNSYFNSTIYSNRDLWCMYRGVPMHVPNLVSSILMALEKFFIDRGKATSNEIFEYWLLYLLKKSNSTIIYGLVNSIVLAFPEKTYSIAKILFSLKDFFLFDNTRKGLDQSLKGQITTANQIIGKPIGTDLHEKARLDACDEKHRKQSLEDLFFSYQIKKIGNITEQQYCLQREELWTILDNYYSQLPNQQESEEKNLWRLCLARIDTRKMEISTHCIDNETLINFIPKLDNDIMQYSQTSLNKIANDFRYMSLKQWAEAKLNQIEISKNHEKYDSTPKLALEEAKEIIKILSQQSDNNLKSDNTFLILNQYTPIYVFTTLIKHYKDILPSEDLSFCISETIGYLLNALQPSYHFQHGSGIDYCFYVLPDIMLTDPTKLDVIKWIILLSLFNTQSITMTGGHHFYNFATNFVLQLWKSHREHAESVLFAYIRFIKKHTELVRETHQKAFNNGIYHPDFNGLPSRFYNENEVDIRDYFNNNLPHPSLEDVNYLELPAKNIALFLIPCESNSNYKDLLKTIIKPTLSILFNKNSKVNHTVKDEFFNNYAKFILSVSINEIDEILQPFIDNLTPSEIVADFLDSIILVQDRLAAHDNFWYVWKKLLPLLTDLINYKYHYHHSEKIIKSYLFVQRWKDSTKSWHTFRPNDKRFFKIAAEKLGENPATLLAFSKLLNDIGSEYRNDGIYWLANIIEKNASLHDTKIDNNTIFYLEKYIKIFIYENKEIIKKTIDLKKCTFVILDFLVNKGEVSAYLLRESII